MLWAVEYVWLALLCLAMAGVWWVAYRMEPHWVSKDGQRFLCTSQDLSEPARPGRIRESRVVIMPDGALHVTRKVALRREETIWTLTARSTDPPRRKHIYLAERRGELGKEMLAVRLPANSRCVATLDGIIARKG